MKKKIQPNFTMNIFIKSFLLVLFFNLISCSPKKAKSDIEVVFTQDTLDVGYTYWWPQSGPFIGACGEELSLVFSGTVAQLMEPTDDAGPLYTPQEGIVEIEKVFKIKNLAENNYANQKYFSSDVFHGLDLKVGDTVLVVCYDYEGDYTIPGKQSILKIASFDDPLVTSIRRYIDTDQNALKLRDDVGIWAKKGLGRQLQEVMKCEEEMESGDPSDIALTK